MSVVRLLEQKIGACGGNGEWNEALRPYFHRSPPLFDGLTRHEYAPGPDGPGSVVNSSLPHSYKVGYLAGYSRAAAMADLSSQQHELGMSVPMWCVCTCTLLSDSC